MLKKSAADSEGWRARGIECFTKDSEWIAGICSAGKSGSRYPHVSRW